MKKFYSLVLLIIIVDCFSITTLKAQKSAGAGAFIIDSTVSTQSLPKIKVASNGWIFAGFLTNTDYRIFKSVDSGKTWTKLIDILGPLADWDMEVAGGTYIDTAIQLLVATVAQSNSVKVFSYNGRTGTPTFKLLWFPPAGDTCKNVAIATDFKNPGFVANPYSIAMAFSVSGNSGDSLLFYMSNDSGNTWKHSNVYTTIDYLHRVSLAYGYSPINNTGLFFLAGEYNYSRTESFYNQDIFYMWEKEDFSGIIGPGYVDSVNINWVSNVSNPDIIVENSNSNENDSLDLSAMILFNTNNGLSAVTTQTAIRNTTNYKNWYINNISSNYGDTAAPTTANGVYDQQNASFIFALGDSVKNSLNYYELSIDSAASKYNTNGYTPFKVIYSDTATPYHLVYAYPHCDVDQNDSIPVAVWIGNRNGDSLTYTLFSRDTSFLTGINSLPAALPVQLFPNPANKYVNIVLPQGINVNTGVEVYNILGQEMYQLPKIQSSLIRIDVSKWPTGSYYARILNSQGWQISKFVVIR